MSDYLAAFQKSAIEKLFQYKQNKKAQPPEHKIPACTMPQSGQRPYQKHVNHHTEASLAVAPERNIDILPEKPAKRHMPVSPKLRDRFDHIRAVKVFRQVKAHHPAKPDRHQRVSPKIKINLKGVSKSSHPGNRRGKICIANPLHLIPENRNFICQQHLCAQPKAKDFQPMFDLLQCDFAPCQFRRYFLILHDRPCDQLRKHAHIRRKFQKRSRMLHFAAVNITNIRHDLKSIKTDSKRQRQSQQRQRLLMQDQIHILREKIKVFKQKQHSKIQQHGKDKYRFTVSCTALPGKMHTNQKVCKNRKQH